MAWMQVVAALESRSRSIVQPGFRPQPARLLQGFVGPQHHFLGCQYVCADCVGFRGGDAGFGWL